MKKILLFTIFLNVTVSGFSQRDTTGCLSRAAELTLKSQNQKNGAWVLLGGGSALVLAGFLIGNRNESTFGEAEAGVIMGGIGVISMLGSVPLFMASGRNKRKAAAMVSVGVNQFRLISQRGITQVSYPTPQLTMQLEF